jgi:hypothetical protein
MIRRSAKNFHVTLHFGFECQTGGCVAKFDASDCPLNRVSSKYFARIGHLRQSPIFNLATERDRDRDRGIKLLAT